MNERVARLRQRSLEAEPVLSLERAALITKFYRDCRTASVPILRAEALRRLMENKNIYIGSEELIVGERGPAPKATPTYPEPLLPQHGRPRNPRFAAEDFLPC